MGDIVNNAVLVVAGEVTAEEVRPLAEATYGQNQPRGMQCKAQKEGSWILYQMPGLSLPMAKMFSRSPGFAVSNI